VRPGVVADAVAAAQLNTLLWGGRFNPIVAVTDDPEPARRLIRDFRVDLLHAVADDARIQALVEEHDHLRWPFGAGSLLAPRGPDNEIEPTVVDVAPALEHAWARTFRSSESSQFRSFSWAADDELAALFAIWLGEYAGEVGERYRGLYETRLRAEEAEVRAVDFGEHDLLAPLDATGATLRGDVFGRRSFAVVVGDPQDAEHLAALWNVRAAGYRTVFYTGNEQLDRGLVRQLRRHVASYPERREWERHLDLFCLRGEEIPAGLAALLGDDANPILHHGLATAWSDREPPALFATESHSVLASAEEGADGRPLIHIALDRKPFSEARLDREMQQWIASVGVSVEAQYEGTLRLPYLPRLNRFYWDATLRLHEVRSEFDRLGVITTPSDHALVLRPLQREPLIANIFGLAGITATQSPSGHRAHQIVRQLGHLQRCRVFRLPGVRNLLKQREAHMGVNFSRAAQYIREDFAEAEPFYVSGQHLDDPREVFRFLLHQRVFLAAHELTCPSCGLPSLHSARELDDEIRCPQCGHLFLLAPAIRTDQWRYRLTGLLAQPEQHVLPEDRPDRPPEAVAVLLTEVWLHDATHSDQLLLDTNFEVRGDGLDGEIDIVAIERGRLGRTAVVIGECRTEIPFTAENIAKLELLASRLRTVGLDCSPLFATLRNAFSDEEIALFRELRDRERYGDIVVARPPILLTRADLERGDFARSDLFEHSHVGQISGIAEAADRIYLRDRQQ
jgi:DNA-directed RNA polymerase subunit RPC12/RpoP